MIFKKRWAKIRLHYVLMRWFKLHSDIALTFSFWSGLQTKIRPGFWIEQGLNFALLPLSVFLNLFCFEAQMDARIDLKINISDNWGSALMKKIKMVSNSLYVRQGDEVINKNLELILSKKFSPVRLFIFALILYAELKWIL